MLTIASHLLQLNKFDNLTTKNVKEIKPTIISYTNNK